MYKTNANNYKHDWCIKGFGTQGSQTKDLTSVEQICEKKLKNRKTTRSSLIDVLIKQVREIFLAVLFKVEVLNSERYILPLLHW